MTSLVNYSTGIGTIIYGSVTIPPTRHYKLTGKMVYDRAERAVQWVEYTLEVVAVITADTEANEATSMQTLRAALSKPGQTLTIDDIGLGGMPVDGQPVVDMSWGPKPRVISMVPLGGLLAWEVTWTVDFRVTHCIATTTIPLRAIAYNYRVGYSINQEGLTTRQISGFVEIAQTRIGDGSTSVSHNADEIWEQVQILVPVGFRRIRTDRGLSESKNRLEFSVVDEELIGEALPAGIVDGEIDFDIGNVPPGFSRFSATVSGTLTTAPGYPYSLAPQKFFIILADRLQQLRTAVGGALNDAAVIPTRIRFGRGLFGRTSRFLVEFTLVGCLTDILNGGGVWQPLGNGAGGNWQEWATSMQQIWHPRGNAKLFHSPGSDAIISICDAAAIPVIDDQPVSANASTGIVSMPFGCDVTEARSYLAFENKTYYFKGETRSKHKLAQAFDVQAPPPNDPFSTTGTSIGNYGTGPSARADIIETTGSSEEKILMVGKSLRLGFQPSIPTLESVGGSTVREYQRMTEITPVGNFFGCKLYRARWAILYDIVQPISGGQQLQPARNKLVCQD